MTKYIKSHKADVPLYYFWYHHMIPVEIRDYISQLIQTHSFYSFSWIKYVLECYNFENDEDLCYLPDFAYTEDGDTVKITNEKNFSRIAHEECECG